MEISLVFYRTAIQKLIGSFSHIQSREPNRQADALAALASKIEIPDETINMKIIKKTL